MTGAEQGRRDRTAGRGRPSHRSLLILALIPVLALAVIWLRSAPEQPQPAGHHHQARHGGRLVVGLETRPQTLNPAVATDAASLTIIRRMAADLVHINRETHGTEPALASSWTGSEDGRRYTVQLREGVRFSDGQPFDADDVVFSFTVYLDQEIGCPQRDLLIVGGEPVRVQKINSHTVQVDLAEPYAAAERLFDSFAMLPEHLLLDAYTSGQLASAWDLSTPPAEIAGLGPFRLVEYRPAEQLVLERNPYYWKRDREGECLPYLERLVFLLVPSQEASVLRFQAGELDVIDRLNAESYTMLSRHAKQGGYHLYDLGAGLDFTFLFFNLNQLPGDTLPQVRRRQTWFRNSAFRLAVSRAVDRTGIVRLVYRNRGTALATHVTPGNKRWLDHSLDAPGRSLEKARVLLEQAGFRWSTNGSLEDAAGHSVELSILTSAGNDQSERTAAIIQDDLRQLGIVVHVVSLELRALLERLFQSHDYDACLLGLGGGDADPNSVMSLLLSGGSTHLWSLAAPDPLPPWQVEIDRLMHEQLTTLDYEQRKQLYDKVQALVARSLPFISLVSPNVLVGARAGLGGLRPAILDHHVLWNVDEIYWRNPDGSAGERATRGRQ